MTGTVQAGERGRRVVLALVAPDGGQRWAMSYEAAPTDDLLDIQRAIASDALGEIGAAVGLPGKGRRVEPCTRQMSR